jgi:drug/metabolite transporter (DMT)-like permease
MPLFVSPSHEVSNFRKNQYSGMILPMWALYAIIAAILWGVDYALTEKALQSIRFPMLLSIELFFGFLTMLGIAVFTGSYKADLAGLFSSHRTMAIVVAIVVAFNIANMFIVLSIGEKNATLSGLIEISYPLFVALFSLLFFKENNLSAGAILGGVFVLGGVSLIYFSNK